MSIMRVRKGYQLSINIVVMLVVGAVFAALLIGISQGVMQGGKNQIITLGGL